jgi:hypothetical protein
MIPGGRRAARSRQRGRSPAPDGRLLIVDEIVVVDVEAGSPAPLPDRHALAAALAPGAEGIGAHSASTTKEHG